MSASIRCNDYLQWQNLHGLNTWRRVGPTVGVVGVLLLDLQAVGIEPLLQKKKKKTEANLIQW